MAHGHSLTSFVGRERGLAEVRDLLGAARLLTVTGPGGIGKTRLVFELATRVDRAFADGVHVVDLASLDDRADVAAAIAAALAVPDQSNTPPVLQVARHLAGTRSLLVLDNCEHVLGSATRTIVELLSTVDELCILATSREPLGVAGERIYPLGPMTVPAAGSSDAVVEASEAVRLLADRARGFSQTFAVTDQNRDAVVRLCERLDGMPLAIELAAARLRSLSVEQVLARLDQRFSLLTGGMAGDLPRHRTLWDLVDWSHELCTPEERILWARLAVFPGTFDLDAAESVCGFDELPAGSVLDLLDRLVAKSILTAEPAGASMRYRSLVTIREYGAQRLRERDEWMVTKRRHRDHFLAAAGEMVCRWCGPQQPETLAAMRADHANLLAALEWSTTTPGEERSAAELASLLRYHWIAGGHLSEGRRWFERILELDLAPTAERGAALWVAAWVALIQGDREWAGSCLSACRAVADELADELLRAHADHWTGLLLLFSGRLPESCAAYERAIETFEAAGDEAATTTALFQLAMAKTYAGEHHSALQTCGRVLTIGESRGEQWSRAYALWVAGVSHWHLGAVQEARSAGRAALEYQRAFQDGICIALTVELLAWLDTDAGAQDRAAVFSGAARAVWRQLGTTIAAFGPDITAESSAMNDRLDAELGAERVRRFRSESDGISRYDAVRLALDGQVPNHTDVDAPIRLTPRESEVARLIAEGLSNRAIAERLVISVRTVDGHVERMLAKLEVGSRTQIATWMLSQAHGSPESARPGS